MACFRMTSVMVRSYDVIPGTAAPLIGTSGCDGGGGAVGSRPQDSRTARQANGSDAIGIDLRDRRCTRFTDAGIFPQWASVPARRAGPRQGALDPDGRTSTELAVLRHLLDRQAHVHERGCLVRHGRALAEGVEPGGDALIVGQDHGAQGPALLRGTPGHPLL